MVLPLSQTCDLCSSLSVHQATIQRHEHPDVANNSLCRKRIIVDLHYRIIYTNPTSDGSSKNKLRIPCGKRLLCPLLILQSADGGPHGAPERGGDLSTPLVV